MRPSNGPSASILQTSETSRRQFGVKVLVVDDHPVVRKGVRALIECRDRFEIVGEAQDGLEAIEMAERFAPDIVVTDLTMPIVGGLEAIAEIKRHDPRTEVLVYSMHRGDRVILQVMQAGARGYVCKNDGDHLLPALEAVSRGESYLSPTAQKAISQDAGDETWDRRTLTVRETQIVTLVARGHSNKTIARSLKISVKTVETHRAAAMRKCGTNTAAELTIYAARNGLVDL